MQSLGPSGEIGRRLVRGGLETFAHDRGMIVQRREGAMHGAGELVAQRLGAASEGSEHVLRDEVEMAMNMFGMAVQRSDGLVERGRELLLQRLGLLGERRRRRVGGGRKAALQLAAMALELVLEPRMPVLERGDDVAARLVEGVPRRCGPRLDQIAEAFAGRGDAVGERAAMHVDHLLQAIMRFSEARRDALAALGNRLGDLRAGGIEAFRKGVAAHAEVYGEKLARIGQARLEVGQLLIERLRDAGAGLRQIGGGVAAGAAEARDKFFAVTRQMLGEFVAALVQRQPDLVAFGVDRIRDAAGGLADAVSEADRRRFNVAGDAIMGDRDGAAHAIGIGENGFALAGQLVDQRAHAPLVIGKGALQIGDLGPHQGFKFAGPRQGALNAIAHGGDLAPDRLGERDHLLGGDGLGFGEAQRDFGHRAGGRAHFLPAPDHHRRDEEKHHRPGDGEEVKRGRRQDRAVRSAEKLFPIGGEEADRQRNPQRRAKRRDDGWGAVWAGLVGAQDRAGRMAVVIGWWRAATDLAFRSLGAGGWRALARRSEKRLFAGRRQARSRAGFASVISRRIAPGAGNVPFHLIFGAGVPVREGIVQFRPQVQRFFNGLKRLRRGIVDFRGARHLVPLQSRSGARRKFSERMKFTAQDVQTMCVSADAGGTVNQMLLYIPQAAIQTRAPRPS